MDDNKATDEVAVNTINRKPRSPHKRSRRQFQGGYPTIEFDSDDDSLVTELEYERDLNLGLENESSEHFSDEDHAYLVTSLANLWRRELM